MICLSGKDDNEYYTLRLSLLIPADTVYRTT